MIETIFLCEFAFGFYAHGPSSGQCSLRRGRRYIRTILVRAPGSFINQTLWPEYLEISRALEEYLHEATERIIREEVFGDADEAEEQPESPAGLLAPGEPAPGFAD